MGVRRKNISSMQETDWRIPKFLLFWKFVLLDQRENGRKKRWREEVWKDKEKQRKMEIHKERE